MVFQIATRPESVIQILSRSLTLYRMSFFRVFILALLVSIVVFLPRMLLLFANIDIFVNISQFNPASLWLILTYVTSLFFCIGILWRLHCVMTQTKESLFDDVKVAIKKLPLIVAAAILQSLLFALMNITLGIYFQNIAVSNLTSESGYYIFILSMCVLTFHVALMIYIYFLLIMYIPLILTENQGIIAAFKKSAMLVWNNWWHTFIVFMIPWLCYVVLLMLLRGIFKIPFHVYFITEAPSFWTTCLHILIFSLFIPWTAAVFLLQLRDLERRKTV